MTKATKALPTFNYRKSKTQEEKNAKKKFECGNIDSYCELLSSVFDAISFSIVDKTKTED